MHKNLKFKKTLIFAVCLTMLTPMVLSADAEKEDTNKNDTSSSAAETTDSKDDKSEEKSDSEEDSSSQKSDKDDKDAPITDEEAANLKTCKKAAENDNFVLYYDKRNDRVGLFVKASGKYWWSSPINVKTDSTVIDKAKGKDMKMAVRKQVSSSFGIRVGEQATRSESPAAMMSNVADVDWDTTDKGLIATYDYTDDGITVKVHYDLEDDNLHVYCDTKEITEKDPSSAEGKFLTRLEFCPYFGAAPRVDEKGNPVEGYMIIPDGSGAVINYNNGKTDYEAYRQQVFGRDYTTVPANAPDVTEQAYLPVMATVNGSSALMAVASEGEGNVTANAQISGQNNQAYNSFWFEFTARSQDSFFMSGEGSNEITVFEKDNIKADRFGVRYYPLDGENGSDINYADVAGAYRNYLEKNKSFKAKSKANTNDLYVDMFGGVLKQTSILGLPFDLKTEVTGFEQAGKIVDELKSNGVDNITVNYNDWTNNSMKGKISSKFKPSGTLGGSGDFKDFINSGSADVIGSMDNFKMKSSSAGYFTLTNTAIRVSNAYSRQSSYSLAFGTAKKGVAPALLSPNTYAKVFDEMIESYNDEGIKNIGFGTYSSRLVSDFSKKDPSNRNTTLKTLEDGYKKTADSGLNVFADEANSYVLPFVSKISNVPVSSSGFDLTDMDIPFYQMVVHGYVPYASTPINKSSDSNETFLMALSSGSQLHYDMTYVNPSVLQDTDYNDLYYTNYAGWTDIAGKQYKAANDILSAVSDHTIKSYDVSEDGNVITTVYTKNNKDVTIKIDKKAYTANVDGKTYDLADCIEGGLNK